MTTRTRIARLIDHTLLKPEATTAQVNALIAEAADLNTYSVCVSPSLLPVDVPDDLHVATVCGFPSGAHATAVKAAEAASSAAAAELDDLARQFANLIEGAPSGGEEDYVVLRHEGGQPRDFAAEGFEPADHLAIGEGLDIIDTRRGAKVSGARFYYLKGWGMRLELALMTAALDAAVAHGFTPMTTPTLVTPQVMGGTGFLGAHSDEIYYLPADDLYLTGTSEVALAGYHADEILDLSAGPKRYMGWSTCYRREAGAAGKDTRGIIRVHQFNKAEMFSYCRPEDAAEEHQRFLAWEEEMLAKVELPYRVIDTAAGDLGTSAARKFDCEAWLPTQQRWMEVTSTSNCTTYQARRLAIRERRDGGTAPVATLNGTLATTAGSSPSWRTISAPTAPSSSPKDCAPTWAASRSSSPSPETAGP